MSDIGDEQRPAAESRQLSPDERAELEGLRAETGRLRAEAAELRSRQAARRRRISWRTPVAVVLITIGCLLAPVSVLAVWSANQVSDTGRYIANMEPLIHKPAIQNALTDKVTSEITTRLNITGHANQAAAFLNRQGGGLARVGVLLRSLGPSIASAIAGFIHGQVHKLVASDRFAHTWIRLNTVAHQELVKALSGQGSSAISASNGRVVVDLAPFIAVVKQALSARGLTLVNKIPTFHPTLTLFSSRYLVKAQAAYRLINALKIVLPLLALFLIAAGVYVARRTRRALIGAGLGFAASMLVLAAGLLIFRSIYLNSVPSSVLPSDAAAVMFDTLVRFIREALRTLLVLGLVVAIGAYFTGPSATAAATRSAIGSGFDWVRHAGERFGVSTGPVGRWTYAHRKGLRIGAVVLAALIFVFWGRPTALVVILLAVLLLAVLGLIELIGRPAAQHSQAAGHP